MQMRTLPLKFLAIIILALLIGCKKDKGDDSPTPPPPAPPEKKYMLTSFRWLHDGHEYLLRFEFNADKKPWRYRSWSDGTLTADSTMYFYNDKKQLIKSVEHNNVTGATPREIRLYYYNAAGQLIGDTGYNATPVMTYYNNHSYTYDANGRLLKMESSSSYYKRYEYGTGKNPVKSYVKPWDRPNETLQDEYTEYDNKKSYIGVDSVMRIILINKAGFEDSWPISSFANNLVKHTWNPFITDPNQIRHIVQQLEYNDGGYPVKATVTGAFNPGVYYFEYDLLE